MTMGFLPNPDDIRYFQELIRSVAPQFQAAQATYKDFEKTFGASVREAASWYTNQVRILQPVLEQVAKGHRQHTPRAAGAIVHQVGPRVDLVGDRQEDQLRH